MPHFARLALFLSAACLLPACTGNPDGTWATDENHATAFVCTSVQTEPGAPRAYFAPFDEVERETLCALDSAEREVVIAHYNIRRDSYSDKLVALADRGVDVKVTVDATNAAKDYNVGDDELEAHGIAVVRTKPSGSGSLMHLKVTVIDEALALTGSFNWNGTAALANDENMIVLRDPELVERYRHQALAVHGEVPFVEEGAATAYQNLHFSPDEPLDDLIIAQIEGAATSIDIAMFTLTRASIGDALLAAVGRGVRVRLVIEAARHKDSAIDEKLEAAGALVVRGHNAIGAYSAMHQKYAVIDDTKVITGATNWTTNGTRKSAEDLLIVKHGAVAMRYRHNFADLLHLYAGIVDTAVPAPSEAGVLLHTVHGETAWGDRVFVTGNHPALGDWNPWLSIEALTSDSMFPSWTARVKLPPGTRLEYKFVTIDSLGRVSWEPGANRVVEIPSHGRAVVMSGQYGDTSTAWTPRAD